MHRPAFSSNTPDNRLTAVQKLNFWINCSKSGHRFRECLSKFNCRSPGCNMRHHSLLHCAKFTTRRETAIHSNNHLYNQKKLFNSLETQRAVPNITEKKTEAMEYLLYILPVILQYNGHEVSTYAF